MELIFENVKERDEFFEDYCPSHCALREFDRCRPTIDCARCWEQSGVKYSIKGPTPDNPVPIEEQKKNGMFATFEALKSGDAIVKCGGGWYVERKKEEPKRVTLMTHNPYLNVDDLIKPDISPEYRWMAKKIEDYVREVTRGDIQMFMIPARQCGKSELQRRMLEKYIDLSIFGALPEKPEIKKVIFNDPATIVFWKDGTKTVVKVREGDKFDEEKGLAMAICKKVYGEGYWSGMFKEWVPEKPEIKKVIFNDPATIVFWKDGTKTVVKVREGDKFDEEKGLAMAICKKVYGEGYWSGMFKEWVPEKKERSLADVMKELTDRIAMAFGVPVKVLEDLPHAPNPLCGRVLVSEPLKPCEDCKHADVHEFHEPCRSCSGNSGFEEKEEVLPTCENCKHKNNTSNWPCMHCGCITRDMFEPKDAK